MFARASWRKEKPRGPRRLHRCRRRDRGGDRRRPHRADLHPSSRGSKAPLATFFCRRIKATRRQSKIPPRFAPRQEARLVSPSSKRPVDSLLAEAETALGQVQRVSQKESSHSTNRSSMSDRCPDLGPDGWLRRRDEKECRVRRRDPCQRRRSGKVAGRQNISGEPRGVRPWRRVGGAFAFSTHHRYPQAGCASAALAHSSMSYCHLSLPIRWRRSRHFPFATGSQRRRRRRRHRRSCQRPVPGHKPVRCSAV